MKKLIIERMAKAEVSAPCRAWRVVERDCTIDGISSRSFTIVMRDLTKSKARAIYRRARSHLIIERKQPRRLAL